MAKYKITTVQADGTVRSRREVSTSDDHATLIGLALCKMHEGLSLDSAYDLVTKEGSHFGRQMAFCDDDCTIVVTEQ